MTYEILKPETSNDQATPVILLNERQIRFCEAYIRQPVGRYAAMEAGYAPKGAAMQASRLLEHPAIRARGDGRGNAGVGWGLGGELKHGGPWALELCVSK